MAQIFDYTGILFLSDILVLFKKKNLKKSEIGFQFVNFLIFRFLNYYLFDLKIKKYLDNYLRNSFKITYK